MSSLEALSAKVRGFYARVDPNKSQAEMDEVVFAAYSKGEGVVNAELRARYGGQDLNTYAPNIGQTAHPVISTGVIASPTNGYVISQGVSANGYYQQQPQATVVVDPYTNQQRVVYLQTAPQQYYGNGPTPFSSSQPYPPTYDQYRQQKASNDMCFCITALLACLICFD